MISLVDVTLRRDGVRLLDGVTLHVQAGELVLVEGGRGAGKSSLLRVAAALSAPSAGETWIGGRSVSGLQASSLPFVRRNIGYLPPDAALVPGATALENVMLAGAARGEKPARARELAFAALSRIGANLLAPRRTERLSISERRLVAIARAMVGAPPILVLDEPTTALAPDDAGAVLGAVFRAVKDGAAVLCASADVPLAHAVAHVGGRRLTLQAGKVVASPAPRTFIQIEGLRDDDGEAAATPAIIDVIGVEVLEAEAREA